LKLESFESSLLYDDDGGDNGEIFSEEEAESLILSEDDEEEEYRCRCRSRSRSHPDE
jgi:hypothetical protein